MEVAKITELLEQSKAANKYPTFLKTWAAVEKRVDSLEDKQLQLGFADKGVTTYHSENITAEDAAFVAGFLKVRSRFLLFHPGVPSSWEDKSILPLSFFVGRPSAVFLRFWGGGGKSFLRPFSSFIGRPSFISRRFEGTVPFSRRPPPLFAVFSEREL